MKFGSICFIPHSHDDNTYTVTARFHVENMNDCSFFFLFLFFVW